MCMIYKKTLHAELTEFKNKNIRELRKIKKSEPKKYWKFLNGNKNTQAGASLGDLFEHFRDVNSSADADESNDFLNENDIQQEDNAEINRLLRK